MLVATEFDWSFLAKVSTLIVDNRLAFEVAGLVFCSTLIGFLVARWLYKGQVASRSEILRREFAQWRRRMAQGVGATTRVKRDRDIVQRKLRKARA